jgi:hypothetical protein
VNTKTLQINRQKKPGETIKQTSRHETVIMVMMKWRRRTMTTTMTDMSDAGGIYLYVPFPEL